jgi:hypothetical protein
MCAPIAGTRVTRGKLAAHVGARGGAREPGDLRAASPDEIGRIARRFEVVTLAAGQRHGDAASSAKLVVVVRGEVDV